MDELSICKLILQDITKSNRKSFVCSLPKSGTVENLDRGKKRHQNLNYQRKPGSKSWRKIRAMSNNNSLSRRNNAHRTLPIQRDSSAQQACTGRRKQKSVLVMMGIAPQREKEKRFIYKQDMAVCTNFFLQNLRELHSSFGNDGLKVHISFHKTSNSDLRKK